MKIFDVILPERAEQELRVVQSASPELTVPEKQRLLTGRNGLLYLPTHGKYGGIIPKVAQKVGVSRQHVHTTLFPDDPNKLFGPGLTARLIWTETAETVFRNPLYMSLKTAFQSLMAERQVVIKVHRPILNFFIKRAGELGIHVSVQTVSGRNFATYWIRDSDIEWES